MSQNVLAFDFGASSGRAALGAFDGERITLREVHRFDNEPVAVGDDFYWDVLRLYCEIEAGLRAGHDAGGFASVGIDTWGVDYGLLDSRGRLMSDLFHYRDARNAKAAAQVLAETPMEELYRRTGIQFAPFNTVFQLRAVRDEQPWLLENAEKLLMLPDLFAYFLTGVAHTDYAIASTSGLLDLRTGQWDLELIRRLGVPERLFGPVRPSGEAVGPLRRSVCESLMIPPAQVLSVASHDTASAYAATPAFGDAAFLSCGTWSLLGTELDAPNAGPEAAAANFTNEGGYGGKIRFLKNIMGLWLIQQARRHWNKAGMNLSYADLEELSGQCRPFQSFIDVDDERFSPPGDMPGRVREYCAETGQPVPETIGEIMQCIYGSLALKYRFAFETLQHISGKRFRTLHMVGGGIKDHTLCQLAADLCGVPVVAGPVEGTIIGNIAVQLITLGELRDLNEARQVIRASFPIDTYEPRADADMCKIAYLQYKKALGL